MAARPRILAGHKRVGKRFITPLNQIERMQETRYVERIVPELLWMDMINAMFGYRRGIEMTMALCTQVRNEVAAANFTNFAIASKFATVSANEHERLLGLLDGSDVLYNVSAALSPLTRNYPTFPMAWLMRADDGDPEVDLERVSASVERIIDKHTYPASIVQANVLVFRSMSGALHYAEHVSVPDFNAMAEDPDSEAGKHAATRARIGAMMEVVRDEDDAWPRTFWNDNYRLSKCGLPRDEA